MSLSYAELLSAVSSGAAGIRANTELEPLGGPGAKVFPPSYAADRDAATRYAVEVVDSGNGARKIRNVVLDSVASQANRHELALLDAVRDGDLTMPVTSCDFSAESGLEGVGAITDLEAPHRIFDAILRDSVHDGVMFRFSDIGRSITDATTKNAAAIFTHSPGTLLFGGWDSTGPRGGRGAKYERAFTSEITAYDVSLGVKTASRLDPLGIEIKAATLYDAADGGWTLDEAQAARDAKGKPIVAKPSEINHGNVAPSIDSTAGGIVAQRIIATTVISLIQLRRLKFPVDAAGKPFGPERVKEVAAAARATLAALGLAATVLAFEDGLDLRSRCVLAPKSGLEFELIGRAGERSTFTLTRSEALDLVNESARRAAELGLAWRQEELRLKPAPHLAELVRRSRAAAVPQVSAGA